MPGRERKDDRTRKTQRRHGLSLRERILASVTIRASTGCWEFNKKCRVDGYGRLKVGGKLVLAHRASYEAFRETLPAETDGLHSCDNRVCCNPWHIFPGTDVDNQRDRVAKGRWSRPVDLRGTRHPLAKLNDEKVREIRRRAAASEPQASIAASFGVTQATVCNILHRRKWSHVN